jgi:hypothetical protein
VKSNSAAARSTCLKRLDSKSPYCLPLAVSTGKLLWTLRLICRNVLSAWRHTICMDAKDCEVIKRETKGGSFRLGTLRGYERATEMMYRMYARVPGDYAVVDLATREVVASVKMQETEKASKKTHENNFDIFFGLPTKDAIWIESVEGFSRAIERMEEIARFEPGSYFVFSRLDHSVFPNIGTDQDATASDNRHNVA